MVLIQENMSLNWLDVSILMNGTVLSQSSQAYLSLQKWLTEGVTCLPGEVWQNVYVTYFTSEMCGYRFVWHVSLVLCGWAGAVWESDNCGMLH